MTELSLQQQGAVDAVIGGRNVFVTGTAGSGKSRVVEAIVQHLTSQGKVVAITAPTGSASILVNGITLHSHAGVGLANEETTQSIVKRAMRQDVRKKWESIDCLIIDEISMLNPHFFEIVNKVAKVAIGENEPFGGLQVILTGDFYQLAPIVDRDDELEFVFETASWAALDLVCIELQGSFRQAADQRYAELLNRVRVGQPTEDDLRLLRSRIGVDVTRYKDGVEIKPTELRSRRAEIESINNAALAKLETEERTYKCRKQYQPKNKSLTILTPAQIKFTDDFVRSSGLPTTSTMKVGLQVMLTCNLDLKRRLVNGSRGVVVGFARDPELNDASSEELPLVQFESERVLIRRFKFSATDGKHGTAYMYHIPLRVAYAFTIHHMQGCSLDTLKVSLDNSVFAAGQAFVALSRVRTLDGLSLVRFVPGSIRVNAKVHEFYESFRQPPAPSTSSSSAPLTISNYLSKFDSTSKISS